MGRGNSKPHKRQKRSNHNKSNLPKTTELGRDDAAEEAATEHKETPRESEKPEPLNPQETCHLIAELSEAIIENPEKAFCSLEIQKLNDDGTVRKKGPSRMQQLLHIARTRPQQHSTTNTAQLAIVSLLAVFQDILPDYRIRVPSAKEMAIQVSKETKKVWDFERALLHHYQEYLQLLEKTWETSIHSSSLAITSMIALAELLQKKFHFNFRSNLITAVVRHGLSSRLDVVRTACCRSVEHVFVHDTQGAVAVEVTRQVAKLIASKMKKRGGTSTMIQPDVIRTFLSLPLRVHADEAEAAKLATQANAKKRKRVDKETTEIENELQQGRATVDRLALARYQSDTLQAVTLTYFRVLKSENLKSHHIQQLLPVALEGLAKFAHLINIDTVVDVLDVMKNLLGQAELLPIKSALHCILTALLTLQGPGKEMNVDQKEYLIPLYTQLPRLCTVDNEKIDSAAIDTVLQCLTAAFIQRREYSTKRVAAFLKRILAVCLHLPRHASVPLLALARQIQQRYPSTQQMMENEQDVITSGVYEPEANDPELCNPFATSAWELSLLQFHWDATGVKQQGSSFSKLLQMPSETPTRLKGEILERETELFIKYKPFSKQHPLHPKGKDAKRKRQCRFIKPRQCARNSPCFESIYEQH